jgi:hypothetical protein
MFDRTALANEGIRGQAEDPPSVTLYTVESKKDKTTLVLSIIIRCEVQRASRPRERDRQWLTHKFQHPTFTMPLGRRPPVRAPWHSKLPSSRLD